MIQMNLFTKQKQTHRLREKTAYMVIGWRGKEQLGSWRSMGFPCGSEGKVSACDAGDLGSIPGSGRCPGEGNGNPLWYSCLENPMEGEAW